MSDILLYNAFNENQKLLTSLAEQSSIPSRDPGNYSAPGSIGCTMSSNLGIILPKLMTTVTGCIKVWDGTVNYNGGSAGTCCLWTVPSGVTEAEFQIWGAGSNANTAGICCSLSSPGGDGAYAYVRMQVTAAQTYTLCAGGACAYGGYQSSYVCNGCSSFVCGSNNTCIFVCGAPACDSCYPTLIGNYSTGALCNGYSNSYYDCSVYYNIDSYTFLCSGYIATSNTLINCASVRARKGGWAALSSGCNYIAQISATHINSDHSLTRCFMGASCDCGYEQLTGALTYGCFGTSCGFDRGPGFGGMGVHYRFYCYPNYAGGGSSGQVIVRYR